MDPTARVKFRIDCEFFYREVIIDTARRVISMLYVKEIYKQLLLSLQFGCITTMNIHKRYSQGKETTTMK